MAAIAEPKKM